MFKLIAADTADADEFEPNIYDSGLQFAVPHLKRRTISMCTDFQTCREIFMEDLRSALFGIEEFENYQISRSFLPMLFLYGKMTAKTATKRFEASVKLINIFEAHLGWSKTIGHTNIDSSGMTMEDFNDKIVPVFNNTCFVYLTVSPKQWMRAPQLTSLYLLIMRMIRTPGLSKATNIKEFNKLVGLRYKRRSSFAGDITRDLIYYWENLTKITLILEQYKYLFSNRSINYTWDPEKYSQGFLEYDQIGDEGISNLCQGCTYDKPLAYKLKSLCDANNIKHTIDAEWS